MVIYLLQNKITKDVYIGQTHNFKNRMCKYRSLNCRGQPKLYNAIAKYGFDNFEIYVLQNCNNQSELHEYEKYYIKLYKSNIYGYNCSEGGENTTKGHKYSRPNFTNEHRKNMSLAHLGKASRPSGFNLTQDHKEKLKQSNQYRSTQVRCISTGQIFQSISECARQLNIDKAQLQRHLNNKPHHNTIKGLIFKFV